MEDLLSESARAYLSRFYQIFDEMTWRMCGAELGNSISHNFIVQMIPHHRAAVELSKNLLWHDPGPSLRRLARDIISRQTKGIAALEEMLDRCGGWENPARDAALYQRQMEHIMSTMRWEMAEAPHTNNVDADFIGAMIPHHKGSVRMAEAALQYELCPELTAVLRETVAAQKQEIRELEALRCRKGNRA